MRHILALAALTAILVCALSSPAWPADAYQAHPAATADQWKIDPNGSMAKGLNAAKSTEEAASNSTWLMVAGGLLAALSLASKTVPGVGGMVAGGLHSLAELLMPARLKQAQAVEDDIQATAAQAGATLVQLIQQTGNHETLDALKAKILAKAPSGVADWINAQVAALEAQGVDHPVSLERLAQPLLQIASGEAQTALGKA